MRSAYLFGYNLCLALAWAYLLHQVLQEYDVKTGVSSRQLKALYARLERPLQVTQSLAIMEVFNSAIGLVKAPVATTAVQVTSRLWLVWGILAQVPSIASKSLHLVSLHPLLAPLFAKLPFSPHLNFVTLMVAWATTEVIRYGFFALQELGSAPYIMLWLRYTTFYVLYPLGVSSELAMAYLAMPTIKRDKIFTLEMPNAFNFAFDYYTAIWVIMAIYVPGFYTLYTYMIAQRKKKLGGAPKPAVDAKKKN